MTKSQRKANNVMKNIKKMSMCRNFCKFKNEHLVFCVIQRTEQSEAELKLAYYTENYLKKYRKNKVA